MIGEQCNDGNSSPNDGCSDTCQIEAGYECTPLIDGFTDTCTIVCGDGVWTLPEECDDSNLVDGDGCSQTCVVEEGYTQQGSHPTSVVATVCGDGKYVSAFEGCDDGGTTPNDGCNALCQIEASWICINTDLQQSTCS